MHTCRQRIMCVVQTHVTHTVPTTQIHLIRVVYVLLRAAPRAFDLVGHTKKNRTGGTTRRFAARIKTCAPPPLTGQWKHRHPHTKCKSSGLPFTLVNSSVHVRVLRRSLNIPFPTVRQAQIAYDVLRIDPEPTRSAVHKELRLDGSQLAL